jgi:Ca-activated chloride channel homolog
MVVLLEWVIVLLFTGLPRPAQPAQFASGVSLVEVYATVVDQRGEPVGGLTAADFQVLEDGAPQSVTTFAAGDVPLSIVIALDRSFSMAGERLSLARRAAAAFVRALRDNDEVMVLAVGSEIETIAPPVPARQASAIRWDAIEPWGTTPLYDVTVRAIDAVQQRHGRRALLVISDGADRGSETTAAALIDHARRSDVLIYPVAIGRERPPILAELASVSGGRSIFVRDGAQLESQLSALARELRMQYLLGYAPRNAGQREPAWHAIDVLVKGEQGTRVRVRARDGYFGR